MFYLFVNFIYYICFVFLCIISSFFSYCLYQVAKRIGIPYNKADADTMAILKAEVEDCAERPHSKSSLAAIGEKEYLWTWYSKEEKVCEKKQEIKAKKDFLANLQIWLF